MITRTQFSVTNTYLCTLQPLKSGHEASFCPKDVRISYIQTKVRRSCLPDLSFMAQSIVFCISLIFPQDFHCASLNWIEIGFITHSRIPFYYYLACASRSFQSTQDHTLTCTSIQTFTHAQTHTHAPTHTCTHVQIHIYTCMHTHVYTCMHIHTYTYAHICIYTHIHTCTHMRT